MSKFTPKELISFNIQSYSDIITNSSSELFTFVKPNLDIVTHLLDQFVEGWRDEYSAPIFFKDMSYDDQVSYIDWVTNIPCFYDWDSTIEEFNEYVSKIVHRLTLIPEEEIPTLFINWNQPDIMQIGNDRKLIYYRLEWSDKGISILRDKYKYDICLWSIDDNPDWERQKKIMEWCEGKRYHLG